MTETAAPAPRLIELTAELVTCYVAHNAVAAGDLAGLIVSVHGALLGAGSPPAEEARAPVPPPAVSVRKSLADPNRIVSMIDGKAYASLKRHLRAYDLTPEEYRIRYGLASDYPMVAPGYSEKRRATAKAQGLGRKPAAASQPARPSVRAEEEVAKTKPGRKPRALTSKT